MKRFLNNFRWYRASTYEFHSHSVIRPSEGASVAEGYDPWRRHEQCVGSDEETPYVTLMDIARRVKVRGGMASIDSDTMEKAVSWINTNGLLGVMLHEVQYFCLSPQEGSALLSDPLTSAATYWRQGPFWLPSSADPSLDMPAVALRQTLEGSSKEVSITKALGPYFPSVPDEERDTYQYPYPGSQEFWTQYSEPIGVFFAASIRFTETITTLLEVRGDRHLLEKAGVIAPFVVEPKKTLYETWPVTVDLGGISFDFDPEKAKAEMADERRYDYIHEAFRSLEALLAGAGMYLSVDDQGEYMPSWRGPSLLSCLTAIALDDALLGSAKVAHCASSDCNRIYRKTKPTALYCSDRCRKREEMRKYRARVKKAKKLKKGARSKKRG